MTRRFVLAIGIGLAIVGLVSADDNVRDVQMKLRDGGFYSGEIDGASSSDAGCGAFITEENPQAAVSCIISGLRCGKIAPRFQ